MINVCQAAEKYFRFFNKTTNIFNKNIKDVLQTLIVRTVGVLPNSVYNYFEDHIFDDDPIDNHANKLIKLIRTRYFKLRIHHETPKNTDRTPRIRSSLRLVIFKNQ